MIGSSHKKWVLTMCQGLQQRIFDRLRRRVREGTYAQDEAWEIGQKTF